MVVLLNDSACRTIKRESKTMIYKQGDISIFKKLKEFEGEPKLGFGGMMFMTIKDSCKACGNDTFSQGTLGNGFTSVTSVN